MIAQYTQAGIVWSSNGSGPASVDSIPSSAMQEDHVSMGWSAARKLRRAIDGLTQVRPSRCTDRRTGHRSAAPLAPAPGTGAVRERCCAKARRRTRPGPPPGAGDRDRVVELAGSGAMVAAAEEAVRPLG